MTQNKDSSTYWFLPSISDVIFILILAIILSVKGNLLGDADTGYHIRAGEYILDNLKVPHYDIFSFTTPPIPWTAHEWLSEVIFALIHKVSGLSGLVVGMTIVIASTYTVLLKFLRSSGVNIIVAACIVALAAGASTIHWLARPHIFSLLLTLIWYIILDSYQYKKKDYLYLLPLLMLLWVNLHGGFLAGFMLLMIYIAGNLLKAIFVKEDRHEGVARIKILLLIFFLCLLASLLNPQGYKILLFPFKLTANKFIMDNVSEWLSPNFHTDLRYEYMLLLMILVFGVSILKLNAIEAMLVILFTHMSLFSARYIPLYAIILSPIIARRIDHLIKDLSDRKLVKRFLSIADRATVTDSQTKGYLWSLFAVAALLITLLMGKIEYTFDAKKLPVDAVQFMKKEKITGNMFNNDEFGDYIIYAAWPEYKVFFDGRSDMYGVARMKEYIKVVRIEQGWDEVLKKYNINWIIYGANSALSQFLLARDDWKLVYADKVANIFVRNTPENKPLINKYPDVKPVKVEEKDDKED
jgi:hypothetical protein